MDELGSFDRDGLRGELEQMTLDATPKPGSSGYEKATKRAEALFNKRAAEYDAAHPQPFVGLTPELFDAMNKQIYNDAEAFDRAKKAIEKLDKFTPFFGAAVLPPGDTAKLRWNKLDDGTVTEFYPEEAAPRLTKPRGSGPPYHSPAAFVRDQDRKDELKEKLEAAKARAKQKRKN